MGDIIELGNKMIDMDDSDRDDEDTGSSPSGMNKKKILMVILPAIVIIGLLVSFYTVFSGKEKELKNYNVVSAGDKSAGGGSVIFYDLPEITAMLKGTGDVSSVIVLKASLETTALSEQNISNLDGLSSKISDIIIAHLVELTPAEIGNSEGLYWLKEELLYRINLVTAPIKINAINFKSFEIKNDRQ